MRPTLPLAISHMALQIKHCQLQEVSRVAPRSYRTPAPFRRGLDILHLDDSSSVTLKRSQCVPGAGGEEIRTWGQILPLPV